MHPQQLANRSTKLSSSPAEELYDCSESSSKAETWAIPQRAWCCMYKTIACKGYYQCHSGLEHFQKWWSSAKQAWCCTNEHLGCHGQTATPDQAVAREMPIKTDAIISSKAHSGAGQAFDCMEGLWNWEHWKPAKKKWCCANKLRFCPGDHGHHAPVAKPDLAQRSPAVVVNSAFDCHIGQPEAWPPKQKQWCCQHQQLGCPEVCSITCKAGGRSESCAQRVAWIKGHKVAGKEEDEEEDACAAAHKLMGADCAVCSPCKVDFVCPIKKLDCEARDISAWSWKKKQECCKTKGIACSSLFPAFDCHFQVAQEWTLSKAAWCCKHEGHGCSTTQTTTTRTTTTTMTTMTTTVATTTSAAETTLPELRAASAGFANSTLDVVPSGEDAVPMPSNCTGLTLDEDANLSSSLAEWCCKHKAIGCVTREPVARLGIQRKYRLLPDQLARRLEGWIVPTLGALLSLIAISGSIRTCSRSSLFQLRSRAEDVWGRSSRMFRPIDLEADGQERELLLELPSRLDRMDEDDWPQRC